MSHLLPKELWNQIIIYSPLNNIKNILLVNSFFYNININWHDYFIYHNNIDMKINVDKNFMIEHGRYLLNKPLNIIQQYLNYWPKLIKLNLTDINNEIMTINLLYRQKEKGYISIFFSDESGNRCKKLGSRYYFYNQIILKPTHTKRYQLTAIYDELKLILLTEDFIEIHTVTVSNIENL